MDHHLPQYQHTSRRTSQGAHCPTLKVWCEWFQLSSQLVLLISESGSWATRIDWSNDISVATRGEVIMPTLLPSDRYIIMALSVKFVAFHSQTLFQKLLAITTQFFQIFNKSMWFKNSHFPICLNPENMERVRKITTWAVLYIRRDFLSQGKCLLSFNLIPTLWNFRAKQGL